MVFILVFGFVSSFAVALTPDRNADTVGVVFSPDLSQNQIINLVSQTSLRFVSFTASDNIIVVEGDRDEFRNPTLQPYIWFHFNPIGLAPCGAETKQLAFKKI
jgi:trans-2-enoyl-CoA reductase